MSQLGNTPADNATVSSQSQALDKYWCFMCEREFSHAKNDSAEVFCPECNCISELIETENDPRSFRPFDARREVPQAGQNTQANTASSGQPSQNAIPQMSQPQMNAPLGINVIYQTMMGPMRSINIQNFFSQPAPNQINQNGGISQPQINPVQNQPGAPQQNQNAPLGGATLFNPLMNNVFGMFNSMLSGASMQGGFLDMNSPIIEAFLRNDPNRHGPPPAPEESISKLKKSQYSETCKVKDCPVCQEDYKNGDNIITLPCDHIFHKDCAETWLKMHNSCPSCRKPLSQPRDSYSENMFA